MKGKKIMKGGNQNAERKDNSKYTTTRKRTKGKRKRRKITKGKRKRRKEKYCDREKPRRKVMKEEGRGNTKDVI